jgi:Transglutaminase-like superfamily
MWEALRRFNALEPTARGLFLRAAAILPLVSLSLRVRGFQATQLGLQKHILRRRSAVADRLDSAKTAQAALAAQMVNSAAYRTLGKATCLERSLALWWLLGRQGIASSVRIGTRKVDDKFEAHAWVDCDGVALNEPEELHRHYAAFDEAFPVREAEKKDGKP